MAMALTARRRDALALEHRHIADQEARRLYRHAPRILRDREELRAAGLLGLVRAARRYDPASRVPFGAYARLLVRGAILDAIREAMPLARSAYLAGAVPPAQVSLRTAAGVASAEDVARDAETADRAARLRRAVAGLPPRVAEVMRATWLEETDCETEAAILGCSEAVVWQRRKAGLAAIRRQKEMLQ